MQGEGQPAAPLKVEFSFKRRNLCLHSVFPTKIIMLLLCAENKQNYRESKPQCY